MFWYQDIGGTRSQHEDPRRRADFQRLLRDAKAGKFDTLAVEEQSRFGVSDVYDWTRYMGELRRWGVTLYEAQAGRVLNPHPRDKGAVLTSQIGAMTSSDELDFKATRTLGEKVRRAAAGSWQGGHIPHGSAVLALDQDGQELWRVELFADRKLQIYPDGREIYRDHFPRDRGSDDVLHLVPSCYQDRRDSVKFMMEHYAAGAGAPTIARQLNALGYRLQNGGLFYPMAVLHVLSRGAHHTGRYAWGKCRAGKYASRTEGIQYELVDNPTGKRTRRPPEEWLWSEPIGEPLISRELFDQVQSRLQDRHRKNRKRAPKDPRCWLSGMLTCSTCKKTMTANANKRRGLHYCCTSYQSRGGPANEYGCGNNAVSQAELERLVGQYLEDTHAAVSEVKDGPLLAPLYSERSGARERLREVRKAVEDYLYEQLGSYFNHVQHEGYRVFTVELPDGDASFRLPGYDGDPVLLEELLSLAEQADGRQNRDRLRELRAEHDRLYGLFSHMPTEMMRQRLLADVNRVEAEISALEAGLPRLGSELRAVWKQLVDLARRVAQARKALREDEPARKREALQRAVSEIVLEFEWVLSPRKDSKGQRRSVLARVRFVPHLGDELVLESKGARQPRPA
jgi:hypothetical protein